MKVFVEDAARVGSTGLSRGIIQWSKIRSFAIIETFGENLLRMMPANHTYLVPDLPASTLHCAEAVIKRSRFIATVARVASPEAAKAFVDAVKKEHPTANHNCWAYNAGAPETTARIGASDDGEPKGTAGRPMMNVLLHCGVGEIAVVVTRYFGGTLLGTGGLVKAYQDLVKLGLADLPVREKVPSKQGWTAIEPRFLGRFLHAVKAAGAEVLQKEFAGDVHVVLEVPDERWDSLSAVLREITAGRSELKPREASGP